jgi:hypothetical protein
LSVFFFGWGVLFVAGAVVTGNSPSSGKILQFDAAKALEARAPRLQAQDQRLFDSVIAAGAELVGQELKPDGRFVINIRFPHDPHGEGRVLRFTFAQAPAAKVA